jgi:hypothetical protein
LRISFEITKSVISFPNLARISIYNVNSETLSLLQTQGTLIVLNAGYSGNKRVIFRGEIRNIFQAKQGVDRIVTIYAADGDRDFRRAIFNKTFTENVTISAAIQEVLESFKDVAIGTIQGLPMVADKLRGQTLTGKSADILDQFADEYNFDWNILDGEIVITPNDSPIEGIEAVLINFATGMIGLPTITESQLGVGGVEVTSLLNPLLIPNGAFIVEASGTEVQVGNLFFRQLKRTSANGLYKCQEVTFRGDSREGEWVSIAKGKAISNG